MVSVKNIFKKIGFYGPIILAGLMVYLSVVNYQYLKLLPKVGDCMYLLLETRAKIERFRAENGRFPRSACEMGLAASYDIDPITGEPFQWASNEQWMKLEKTGVQLEDRIGNSKVYPLVWQPRPFRVPCWLFGKKRQYALFSDWTIRDMLAKDKQ